jgi:hypothetical protein
MQGRRYADWSYGGVCISKVRLGSRLDFKFTQSHLNWFWVTLFGHMGEFAYPRLG